MAAEKKQSEVCKLIFMIEQWKKQKRWTFITAQNLCELMKNTDTRKDINMLQVIDVRHSDQDCIGGHIQ